MCGVCVEVGVDTQTASTDGNSSNSSASELPIIPNYIRDPPFPHYDITKKILARGTVGDTRTTKSDESTALGGSDQNSASHLSRLAPSLSSHSQSSDHTTTTTRTTCGSAASVCSCPLLVKARVAESGERDFVEVELESLTYQALLSTCCEELEVRAHEVHKIRKLPNVWVRKDKDVQRLKTRDQLEIVLKQL